MINLYVNDELVDVSPGTRIATNIKRIDFNSLASRFVNYTSSIKLPITENNSRIFGYPENIQSGSKKPYQLIPCRYVQNSVDLFENPNIYISRVTKNYEASILENVVSVFENADIKTLKDISPISESGWNPSDIDAARLNTQGIVAAAIGFGKSGAFYQSTYFLPCFFYHTLIKAILQDTGLTLSGNILTDSRFTDLVVPLPGKFQYTDEFISPSRGRSYRVGDQVQIEIPTGVDIPIDFNVVQWGSDNFSISGRRYTFPQYVNAEINVPITITIDSFNDGTTVSAQLIKNNVDVLATENFTTSETRTLSFTGDFDEGDFLEVITNTDAPITGISYTIGGGGEGNYFDISPTIIPNKDYVYWNEFFRDVNCIDLLQDFFARFFLIPKQVGNTLYLKTISEIITDKVNVIDWSDKLAGTDVIDILPDYAQENYFNYSNSPVGSGFISISNTVLKTESDLFTSVFEPVETRLVNSAYICAYIPVYDSSSTATHEMDEVPLTILTLKNRSIEPSITFNSTARTDYKIAYFIDSGQAKDSGFQYFIDQFYPEFQEALQTNKVITKLLILNELDIASYDPHKLIYDGYGYYILNEIKNFIGKITKVELFKVL